MIERISHRLTRIAVLAMVLYVAGARADAPEDKPMFSFSGFGTLGVVHSSESQADFSTSSVFKPDGAGYTHTWSHSVDSLIGAQVTANFTPQISAILQVISEQNYDGSYRPHVEWANIKYQFTPDFFVRAGRVVMPSFLVSDFRKVGYASPWVRPPVEVYSLVPITKNDGLEASYRQHFGEVTNTIQAIYGSLKNTEVGGTHSYARQHWGIFNTTEYGPLTISIVYHQAHLTIEGLHPFFENFRVFGPQGNAIADKYDCDGKLIPFGSIGASYDPGKWFLMGEWATTNGHCFVGSQTGWYAGGGYRLGKFTPYLTYGQLKVNSNTSDPGLDLTTVPPSMAGFAAGLNAGLNGILGSTAAQETVSIGGRWDFAKSADLKLQFDQTRNGAGSPGTLINRQPGFQPGGKVDLFSIAVDFVF